jgi:hypothetical protein
MKSIFIVDSYTIYVVRISGNGLTDNNSNKTVITGEFRALEYMSTILAQLELKKNKHHLFVQRVVWSIVRNVAN